MAVIFYTHHAGRRPVAVQGHLLGQHRQHCLCYLCRRFQPEARERNCLIANLLYDLDRLCNVTTPVWECGLFVAKDGGFQAPLQPDKKTGELPDFKAPPPEAAAWPE